jgi:hypothetical protein
MSLATDLIDSRAHMLLRWHEASSNFRATRNEELPTKLLRSYLILSASASKKRKNPRKGYQNFKIFL